MKDKAWLREELKKCLTTSLNRDNHYSRGNRDAYSIALSYVDELDEPEVPVIPKFVADWIDAYNLHGNNPLREYRDLESDFNEGWTDEEDAAVYHWINKNPYAFIDALRYGYDAEKEKLYTVDLPHSYELIKLLHTQNYHIKKYSESGFGDYTNTFTEAEIKKIDERLMAFAEEVAPCN